MSSLFNLVLNAQPRRPGSSSGLYDAEMERLRMEQRAYLDKVARGRSVRRVDPNDPRFSQDADDERIAKRMGLGSHIPYGPPKTVLAGREEALEMALPPASQPQSWNPFAGGVRSPVGQFLGIAQAGVRRATEAAEQAWALWKHGAISQSSQAPRQGLPRPGYNADENRQLELLERGE